MRRARLLSVARDNRGAVLVMTALMLPVLIGFSGLVIDIGHWFDHKRHLQAQADAGALAGAREIRPTTDCDDAVIYDRVTSYAGRDYNTELGGESPTVHREYNSPTFYDQPSRVDPSAPSSGPCSSKVLDVKLTETDVPWYFKLFGDTVPYINAHARLGIFQKKSSVGVLPVAAIEVNPRRARAYFVDETTSPPTAITGASIELERTSTAGGLSYWTNPADPTTGVPVPKAVTIPSKHVGLRIALSGNPNSTTCGDPLVACYDGGSANGVVHVRGYSTSGTGTNSTPLARSVELFGGGGACENAYFTALATTYPCNVGVRAFLSPAQPTSVTMAAHVGNTDYPLHYVASGGYWTTFTSTNAEAATIPIASGAGPVDVELKWGNGSNKTFNAVQRVFAAADLRSGPIRIVGITENNVPTNSFVVDSSHDLVVTLGITGTLQNAQTVSDPAVSLKVVRSVAGNASQNQSLDCDDASGTSLRDELRVGCPVGYAKNTGQTCPSAADLWTTARPWNCVKVSTGAATNQVPAGLNERILGSSNPASCTAPNNWSDFGTTAGLPAGDPRIVEVFLTPFGTFSSSGSGTVPVVDFATFYITGWTGQGQGFNNPCQGNGDDPVPGDDPGTIVGHFIKYIDTLNNGGSTGDVCDFDAFGSCVAVLTR